MATPEELLDALLEAARENHQVEFDRLERDLLNRFEGGFAGMPRELYQRYLEVDRAWPVKNPGAVEAEARGLATSPLGPRLLVNTRIPEELLEWVVKLGIDTGRTRSDVLTECLAIIRRQPGLESQVRSALVSDSD
jgi:hypothetical protein